MIGFHIYYLIFYQFYVNQFYAWVLFMNDVAEIGFAMFGDIYSMQNYLFI